jgi:acetyl-CoA C-acetyltransferase
MGRLFSRFTQVAAENPYAWFPEAHTPEEITAVTSENRMICFPYPKRMNAIMSVNQSASVIMTSVSAARAFGIPQDLWIYLWGGGDAMEDPWFVSERPNFHSSPSMSCAARAALTKAGVTMDEVDFLDLYSCFPCAVQIACDELGISEDDPRPLTVTGGLPYAGGPASNYSMHAIATMMGKLRAAPEAKGLVTGNGMYLSKHSAGVYSGTPKVPSSLTEVSSDEAAPAGEALTVALEAEGRGVIETYTVLHDYDGAPETGIVMGRLEDGRRFLAHTPQDRSLLEGLMTEEAIGRSGILTCQDGRQSFAPD